MIALTTAISTTILFAISNVPIANAQFFSQPAVIENKIFQNKEDGFRMRVPDGWVVQDVNNTHYGNFYAELESGFGILALICPVEQAVPDIRGGHNCEQANDTVYIFRYFNLGERPEFASIDDSPNITTDDFLTFTIQELQNGNVSNVRIINSTDTTINVTSSEDPNTTIRTVPVKLAEITYQFMPTLEDIRSYYMLAIAPTELEAAQLLTGYRITYEDSVATTSPNGPPAQIQQIFQGFELISSTIS
jgi:hypothetical protein